MLACSLLHNFLYNSLFHNQDSVLYFEMIQKFPRSFEICCNFCNVGSHIYSSNLRMNFLDNNLAAPEWRSPLPMLSRLWTFSYLEILGIWKIILGVHVWRRVWSTDLTGHSVLYIECVVPLPQKNSRLWKRLVHIISSYYAYPAA